jgi:hypothetical protein
MKSKIMWIGSLAFVLALSPGVRAADHAAPKAGESKAGDTKAGDSKMVDSKMVDSKAPKGKEVTLKGTLGCGKCAFKTTKECQNVLKVKEGGKDVSYTLAQNAVSKDNHEKICTGPKPATVKGTVADEGGKKTLTASEIKVD